MLRLECKYTPVVPILKRWRLEDRKFKVNLEYVVNMRLFVQKKKIPKVNKIK